MTPLHARIADLQDVPTLLAMMEPFNALEHVPWNAEAKKQALGTLLADCSLGLAVVLSSPDEDLGYFVLTWGFDLEWDGRDAFLTELFLLPQARGMGLGRVALAHVEALARAHGARALHLMVRNDNVGARHLYSSSGYISPPRLFLSKELQGAR